MLVVLADDSKTLIRSDWTVALLVGVTLSPIVNGPGMAVALVLLSSSLPTLTVVMPAYRLDEVPEKFRVPSPILSRPPGPVMGPVKLNRQTPFKVCTRVFEASTTGPAHELVSKSV